MHHTMIRRTPDVLTAAAAEAQRRSDQIRSSLPRPTPRREDLTAAVNLTPAGLNWLARAAGSPDGRAHRAGNEVHRLVRDGLAVHGNPPSITDAGRARLEEARRLGLV